jgi:hypothetical protein
MKLPRLFKDQRSAVAVGALLFLAGSACLYDAWQGRGKPTPTVLRPFVWF